MPVLATCVFLHSDAVSDALQASSSQKAKLTSEASLDGLGDEDGKEQQPYTSSLDFLDDYFQQITEQIKLSRERLKREMKEVIGDDDVAPWEREGRGAAHVGFGFVSFYFFSF